MTDWGYRAAAFLARRLPRRMGARIAEGFADLYVATHPSTAKSVARALGRLQETPNGGAPVAYVRSTYRDFARSLLDFLREARDAAAARVVLDGDTRRILDRMRDTRGEGPRPPRPTLVLSGHFGPWESALRWLASEVGPIDALAAPHRSRAVERFFAVRRRTGGVRTLSGGGSAARALRHLRAGGWIAALIDRGCHPRRHVGGLGGLVPIDRAPLLLARRTGADVLAGVSWRDDEGSLHVRFLEPFAVGPRRHGLSLDQAASRLQRFFDQHVRAHPVQWYAWGPGGTRA